MDDLKELVTKLERAFNDRLVSVILYGSGATGNEDAFSDLNIFCVLKQVTPRELGDGEPVVQWWKGRGHPSPLLMSEEEATHSADCFPIEFRDMKEHRKVLYGIDLIKDLHVDPKNYRTQVEHELRSKLLRLRQHAAHILSDDAALLKLCLESSSTFCVLGRHALSVSGNEAPRERRGVVRKLADVLHVDMSPFMKLLDLRQHNTAGQGSAAAASENPREIFSEYLECIRRMVEFVDAVE